MHIFVSMFDNGYYFMVCFNFLAKKVKIIHSIGHKNVENDVILVNVSLLIIFYLAFSSSDFLIL